MEQLLLTLSAAHVFVKFVKCKAGDALKNYPDSQCPTLLIYKGGSVLKQFIKFDSFGGPKATAEGTVPCCAIPPMLPPCLYIPGCLHVAWTLGSCYIHATSFDQDRVLFGVDGCVLTWLVCFHLVCSGHAVPVPPPAFGRTLCSTCRTSWFAFCGCRH